MKNKIQINFEPTDKQDELFDFLEDDTKIECLFGGGAGGGKSYGISALLILQALKYPNLRIAIGRKRRTILKTTTFATFKKVLNNFKLIENTHYTINELSLEIKLSNGSEFLFIDLFQYPSDKDFQKLGGLELTYAFIDEAGEIEQKAKNILLSRIGRQMNEEYKLKGKLFMSCNPSKNFLYKEFYEPSKNNSLKDNRMFIPATVYDNKYLTDYAEQLDETLEGIDKERLLYGNWELAEDDDLFNYDNLLQCINNKQIPFPKPTHLAGDIARLGKDKSVFILFTIQNKNLFIHSFHVIEKAKLNEQVDFVNTLLKEHSINGKNCVFDIDGVGGGVGDYINNSQSILNGGTPQGKENYANLKTQLYFRLSNRINKFNIYFNDLDNEFHDTLASELLAIKRKNIYSDGKITMTSKEEIKKLIGRSPDYSDTLAYCTFFDPLTDNPGKVNVRTLEY